MTVTIPFRDRISCTIAEGCEASGLGRSKLYQLISSGAIETTKVGTRRLVKVKSLLRLIEPSSGSEA